MHAFNEPDEGVVARWAEAPRWPFFSGQAYYEDRQPCDATTLMKFRKLLGEEGVEGLLAQTINVAVQEVFINPIPADADQSTVDKGVNFPTLARAIQK